MKKLPKLFKNNDVTNNNQNKISINNNTENIELKKTINDNNIDKKINNIFNSPKYVYKANVKIITKDNKELKKTIIGRTNNSLITIDDELIDVNNILEINFLN